jgi:ubiquitin carboxyl-terminal hydrolase 34
MASDFTSDLKALCARLVSYNSEQEPLDDLKTLQNYIKELRTSDSEDNRNFLMGNLSGIAQFLLNNKKYSSDDSARIAADTVDEIISLFPLFFSSAKYLEAFRSCAEPMSYLYEQFLQDGRGGSWGVSPEEQEEMSQEWRRSISENMLIDAIKIDVQYDKKTWAKAKVIKIINNSDLSLAFENEGSDCFRTVSRDSHEIAPFNLKSWGDEWRWKLCKGSIVDVCDTVGIWYHSTIQDTRTTSGEHWTHIEVLVGYRVYEEGGEKCDHIGNFRGWSSKFDEWISAGSPRIMPHNTCARKTMVSQDKFNEEKIVDDSNDNIETSEWASFVTRTKKSDSILLVRSLNRAKASGLFQFFKDLIDKNDPWPSFDLIYSIVYYVGKAHSLFHKKFAKEFIPSFVEAIMKKLIDSPQATYRDFNKEKLDNVIYHLENLLKRVNSIEEKTEKIESFNLEISLKSFQTPYLERKIQGLRGISDAISRARFSKEVSNQSQELVSWVKQQDIISEVFGPKGHFQLVQRCGEVITLLSNSGDLTREQLEFIWTSAQKQDEDMRQSVYKMFAEINSSMRPEHLEVIVEFIEAIPPSKLQRDDITLVQEITKYAIRAEAAAKRACGFLWHAIIDNAGYSNSIIDLALETYTGLMKSWELRKNRKDVMVDCVQKIKENKSVTLAIQIIKNLLLSFPATSNNTDPTSKAEAIEFLVNEHNLLDVFFQNLVYFKEECLKKVENKKEDISNCVLFERVKYKEEIEERLSLLQTLVSGAFSITLTRSQMDTLWETFLKRALCAVEREHYLKWLADATESQSQGKKVFDDSDIYSFFIEKVANVEDNYKDMQFEGFGVFKSYFLLVNVSARKMQQTPKQNYMTSSSFYHSEYVRDFEYQVLVPPTSLEGMLCLRKIMIEVDSELVLSNASELFHELYDNVSYSQILETAKEIRSEFIEFALKYIQNGSPEVKKRSMLVLKNFMDECEKQGTPGLQPHGSMLKGDLHTLNFINQINYYPHPSDIQKKFELKVHSNTTIWELRNQVGQHVKCLNDQFKIYRTFSGKEVKDNENGKTLSEIRIRLNETFTLQKRYSKVPRIALLDDNEKLIPQARRIFSSWFNKFADKGDKMSPAGCAAFTSSCTGDTCQGTDKSIQDLFNIYDDDRDGFLTRENFLSFYERSCQNKLITVWSNLNSHFYRGDLRRYDDGEEPADIETLPGFIIMQNQENYELLFSALNVEELANPAWDLLIKLPTDPKVKEMIQTIPNDFDWNSFLDSNCFYKLLYNLQIIEFFMQDLQESNESLQVDGMNKKEWKIKFILTGGFKKLFNILIDFQKSEGIFQKKCLAFVLDLVGMFILAGFASMTPEIFEAVELVRKLSIEEVEGQESKTEKEDQEKGSKIINDLRDEIIKHNLQDHLIGIVDFSKLITKIMEIMAGILNCNESEVEDKHIVESALELWVTCLLHNSSLIESVYNFQGSMDLETLTFTALTHPKLFHVRSIFSKSLANICEKVIFESKMPIPYFLSLLMKKIPTDKQESDKDYSQFFEVFCKLLELDMSCPTQDYEKLIKTLMRAILLHPASEKRTSYLSDKVLVGLLSMAEIIFRYEERFKDLAYEAGFAGEVFMQILFPSLINFEGQKYSLQYVQETFQLLPPKAKCRDSRTAGYRLLSTLMAHHSKNLGVILDLVDELKNEISPVKSWNYSPLTDSRQNYVGIYNLGCICYMNAMLQQFFYVPQFRYSLLAVDDKKPPNPGPNDIDDNVIHQLQRMFGFLELSERQAYHPAAFCYSFKDFSGSPTNISIQQDAQEFLGVIFERLETALKDTDYKYLMQGVFGGKTVSQCICKVCGTVKENLEDFYNLSLDVKHSKTLSESLARFISGDSISDYQCDNCNKKVEITKRTLIEKVPNILIAHLQRIVFNFDTFANEKINTRLEFPMTVDLYPYTKAGLADPDSKSDDFTYDLVGIVVHKGTAEIGHYYSFIKTEPTKWFEFNDSVVKSFK